VAQDTVLFNDTLEYNVNYGKPDASTEDVQNAIAAAQLTEFVSHQPEGLATRVGERGKYLRLWSFDRKRMAAREPTHMEMLKSLFAALSFVLVFQD